MSELVQEESIPWVPVKRSSLSMWGIMFSSGIIDVNIKRGSGWGLNGNGLILEA